MSSASPDPQRYADTSQRAFVHGRDGGQCVYCRCEVSRNAFQADHVEPHCQGGRTSIENLATSCVPCNQVKGLRTAKSFRAHLEREGLELRDGQYEYLLWYRDYHQHKTDEATQLQDEDEALRRRDDEEARRFAARPLARDVFEDIAPSDYRRPSVSLRQPPTGIFGRLQAETIAKHAANRVRGPRPSAQGEVGVADRGRSGAG